MRKPPTLALDAQAVDLQSVSTATGIMFVPAVGVVKTSTLVIFMVAGRW